MLGWSNYPNYYVSATNQDVTHIDQPSGNTNVDACQEECKAISKCSAIEWYSSNWAGSKCKLIISDVPATKGFTGDRWQDAICYIKPGNGKIKTS